MFLHHAIAAIPTTASAWLLSVVAHRMAIAAAFGASALGSAFVTAFTLPNLFRRLLGEGALTSALVPILQEETRRDGEAGEMLRNFFRARRDA